MEEIVDLRASLCFIHEQLEGGKQLMDDRNDVDALIDFKSLSWSWDNPDVDYYRATAHDRSHPQFTNWHFPEYFSITPLPRDANGSVNLMHCVINLPPAASKTGALHTQ